MNLEGAKTLVKMNDAADAAKLLADLTLAELRALHCEAGCEASKSPNKVFLARQVVAALAALPEPAAPPAAPEPEPAAPAKAKREKAPAKTVDELRAEYIEVVGRQTDSTDAGYLKWKIREARKGNVKVGPIDRAAKGDPKDAMVLPLRMDRALVEQLDAHWKANGYTSRMAFIRNALATLIGNEGNDELASAIGVASSDEA